MNQRISHIQPLAKAKGFFAITVVLLSLFVFYEGSLFGLVILAAGIKLGLREGFEVDLKEKSYRKVYSLLGVKGGTWRDLPAIEYVSVFKTKKKILSRVITAEAISEIVVYKLNLFYDRNQHIEAYVNESKEKTFEVAQQVSNILDIEIHDATEN